MNVIATIDIDDIRKRKEREREIEQMMDNLRNCERNRRPLLIVDLLVLLGVVHNSNDAKAQWRVDLGHRW